MKKLAIILAIMAVAGCSTQNNPAVDHSAVSNNQETIIDGSTPRNALDWSGVYEGVFPCADCEGINTTLTLYSNDSFKIEQIYKKGTMKFKPEAAEGKIEWSKTKPLIYLQYGGETRTFFIGEGYVTAYDMDGNPIEGPLNYTLKQVKHF